MPTKNTTRTLLAIIATMAGTIVGLVTAGIGVFLAATTLALTTIAYATGT